MQNPTLGRQLPSEIEGSIAHKLGEPEGPTEKQLENRRLLQESVSDLVEKSNPANLKGFYSYTRSRDMDMVPPEQKVDNILEMIRQKLEVAGSVNLHVEYIEPRTNHVYHRGFRWTLGLIPNDARYKLLSVFRDFDSFRINLSYYSPGETDNFS